MTLRCAKCGEVLSLTDVRETDNHLLICPSCAREYYRRCERCGKWFLKNDDTQRYCNECESVLYLNPCNSYGFKPNPRFKNKNHGDRNLNNRYFGMELEFSRVKPQLAHVLMRDLYSRKFIYNKTDGSLNDGVEIVTNPCDLYSIKKLIKEMEPALEEFKTIRNIKKNAGIHFHVNRKSISTLALYKLNYLLNFKKNNTDKLKMYFMCGRICRPSTTLPDDRYYRIGNDNNIKVVSFKNGGDRYRAMNLNNTNTVEFRLFKSTPDINIILSYIEIVNSLIEFAETHGIKDMRVDNYLVWLESNTKDKVLLNKIKRIKRYYGVNTGDIKFKLDNDMFKDVKDDNILDILKIITNHNVLAITDAMENYKRFGTVPVLLGTMNTNTKIYKELEARLKDILKKQIKEGLETLCV